jgi:NAD(P)-dependent dehydrogenase (short-subunit alcohol dehydrogenase family)
LPAVRENAFMLTGKVAVVTGGGTGLGRAIACEFARLGADVVIASRKPEHLDAGRAAMEELGARVAVVACDIRDPEQIAAAFDAAVEAGDGKWAIGVDGDQYGSASADQKPHILTSMIKHVDTATYDMIKSVVDKKPLVSYQTYDLAHNGVGYSTSGGFLSQSLQDTINSYAGKIKSGTLKVPTTP